MVFNTPAKRDRLLRRIVWHHLPLLAVSAIAVIILYVTRPYKDVLSRASFATAYPALVLLAATLLIGPWNVLRGSRNPVSSDLRRDLGIWAGVVGLIHAAVGQNVHLRGRPWLYYVYASTEHQSFPLRHDLFGFANYTGAVAALILFALVATSNDYSLRALGTPGWKQLQRWNYALFAMAAAHTVAFLLSEKKGPAYLAPTAAGMVGLLGLQIAGFLNRRRFKTRG